LSRLYAHSPIWPCKISAQWRRGFFFFNNMAAVEGSPTKSAHSARPGHVRAWPRIVSLSCGAVALHGIVAWSKPSDLGQCHVQFETKDTYCNSNHERNELLCRVDVVRSIFITSDTIQSTSKMRRYIPCKTLFY